MLTKKAQKIERRWTSEGYKNMISRKTASSRKSFFRIRKDIDALLSTYTSLKKEEWVQVIIKRWAISDSNYLNGRMSLEFVMETGRRDIHQLLNEIKKPK